MFLLSFKAPDINETPRCSAGRFTDYMNILLYLAETVFSVFFGKMIEPELVTLVHFVLIGCFGKPFDAISSTNKL